MLSAHEAEERRGQRVRRLPGWLLAAFGLVLLVAYPRLAATYQINVLSEVLIWGIFAMSLDLLIGYTGLVSFGHAAFFGMGAYAAGIAAIRLGPSLAVGLPVGMLAGGLLALVIGVLVIRSVGTYFLMLTLAFSQVVFAVAFKWTDVTGGSNGLAGVPRPTIFGGASELSSPSSFYYLVLAMFVLSYLLLHRLTESPLGRSLVGIRENETRMRAIGYPTQRFKLAAFVIAGLFAGLAGALFSFYNGFVSPTDVHWTTSGLAMVMVIIGGAGTLIGPVLGAALILVLQNVVSSSFERWTMIMGLLFIAFVLFARRGMVGLLEAAAARLGLVARGE
jgi:branched-chain amino acid transport system permease protein